MYVKVRRQDKNHSRIKYIVHPIIEIYVEISLIEFKQIVKGKASNYSVGWE